VDTALNRFDQARQNYKEALQTSLSIQAYPMALSVVVSAGMMMIATQNEEQALLLAGFATAQSALDGYDQIRLESLLDKVRARQPLAAETALLAQGQQLTYADIEAMLG